MKSHLVHNLIHNKCSTSHVAGIFHQRNTEIQNQNVGQKYDNTSYSAYDAVNQHVFQRSFTHVVLYERAQRCNHPFNSHHRIFTQHKSAFEHEIHKQQKQRIPPHAMRYNGIEHFRKLLLFLMAIRKGFFQGATDEAIFGIHNCRFAIFIERCINLPCRLVSLTNYFACVG
ncbi:hypothetical protein SDC9_86104 [bioreactor metagenome]|uniref:Uncharacterized protein n=1 Tax=bioreactor metagenome TaxID=1076179 RepID=A0A644ZI27_9ZZZZ